MDVFVALMDSLIFILEFVTFYLFIDCFLEKRFWARPLVRRAALIVAFSAASLAGAILTEWYSVQWGAGDMAVAIANLARGMVLFFLLAQTLFSGKLLVKLLLTALYCLFVMLVEGAMFLLLQSAAPGALGSADNPLRSLISWLIYLLVFVLVLVYRRYRKNAMRFSSTGGVFLLQCSIPLMSIVFFSILFTVEWSQKDDADILQLFVILLAFAAINAVQYVVLERYQKLAEESYDNMLEAQDYRRREEYYHQVEKHQEEIRIIRHDLKNQLISISAYTEAEAAAQQLNLIIDDVLRSDAADYTRHVGINALLNAKRRTAEEAGITCRFEVRAPERMGYEEKDLAALLGNVLDNAIEACMRSQGEREIDFTLIYHGHALLLHCENSTDGQILDFSTRKKDKKRHGLGLKSIEAIAKKYGGASAYSVIGALFKLDITLWEQGQAE